MRAVRNVVLFLAAFVVLYYSVYTALFRIVSDGKPLIAELQKEIELNPSHFRYAFEKFDPLKKYDAIFVGSSHTYRFYDPAIFDSAGYSTFNLGSSSQTPNLSEVLIRSCGENAGLVVVEFYPVLLGLRGSECYWDWNACVDDYSLLMKSAWAMKDARCFNLLSIKPLIDSYNQSRKDSLPALPSDRGYVERRDSAHVLQDYQAYRIDIEKSRPQFHAYERICRYLRGKNAVLVFGPIPKEMKYDPENVILEKIKAIAARYGIPFLDYSRNHPLNSQTDFFDDDHINANGVRWFNHEMIKELEQRGLLKPGRN